MKVKDLMRYLEDMNSEAEVHFAYCYGDYWRTEVAPAISRVDEGMVAYSQYHQMDKMIDDDSDEETVRRVVVLS